jgi:propanol-preferring alcohol dehydrogenase
VKGDEVLVRVAGCYVCSSDLGLLDDRHGRSSDRLPMIPGHNVTGYVEAMGSDVIGFKKGEPVAVFGAWGCGQCRLCRQGEEQLCDMRRWMGFGVDGGYAEYLHVPAQRHLIKIGKLDPFEVAPLLDAGLTPYRAIKKTLPNFYPGAVSVIIGVGNIGYFAVQIVKAISPGAKVVAVDVVQDRLELASQVGADHALDARSDVAEEVKKLSGGEGALAIIDTVGNTDTLKTAAAVAAKKSSIVLVGLAGGAIPRLPLECTVTASIWGTYTELEELLALYTAGKIRCQIERFPLERINEVLNLMKTRKIQSQAVIEPSG